MLRSEILGIRAKGPPRKKRPQRRLNAYSRTRLASPKDRPHALSSVLMSIAVIAVGIRHEFRSHGIYCNQPSIVLRVAIQVFHASDEFSSLLFDAGIVLMLSIGLCP